MTVQTLYTSATGMESLEKKLDVIANNMANVGTVGFKKDRANFEDLLYRHETIGGGETSNPTANNISIGVGTRVSSVQLNHSQGAIQQTNRDLDIAVQGKGFLKVQDADGNNLYTRAGNLSINADNQLVVGSAHNGYVVPGVTFSGTQVAVNFLPDGQVQQRESGQSEFSSAGNLTISTFVNQEGLLKVGNNMYAASDASGTATDGTAGTSGVGTILNGSLEMSNVEPVRELIDLIQTQRNFELNSQVVQAGDEVMQLVTNLRR